jgi:hypothetical protein
VKIRKPAAAVKTADLKGGLRRRIKRFYHLFNLRAWERCYRFLDSRLRDQSRIDLAPYADSLGTFQKHYGEVAIWHADISLYADVRGTKQDDRPFAFVYIFWQDAHNAFHVFRERWVFDSGRWYTRVVGLVTHEAMNGRQKCQAQSRFLVRERCSALARSFPPALE